MSVVVSSVTVSVVVSVEAVSAGASVVGLIAAVVSACFVAKTSVEMVAAGAGITILPSSSINAQSGLNGLLEYRPFTNPSPYREIIIAYRKSFPGIKAIELIKKSIANCELMT